MSEYLSVKYNNLTPYTPGEQPQDMQYIKLNTNESPFPPSPMAQKLAREAAGDVQLYSDPQCKTLVQVATEVYGVDADQVLFTNGSDEALNFAFMAFCDKDTPAAFANITYGFYPVYAKINCVPYEEIPLKEDFSICVEDYLGINKTIFIANPNAPTGIALPLSDIEKIVSSNPNNVVVVDEAYVDFGGESAVSLIGKYKNLLVTQTFSKSRSLAGGRLGMAFGCKELIQDLNTMKYSTNPYNVNRMTMAAGIGALMDTWYFENNCKKIQEIRDFTTDSLRKLGFEVLDSKANFVFAKTAKMGGKDLYEQLKEKGVLVRHFDTPLLKDYNRITIGSKEQMDAFFEILQGVLGVSK